MIAPVTYFRRIMPFVWLLVVALAAPIRPATETNEPENEWILLEKAKGLIEDRAGQRMGEALELLRQAIERQRLFPEAEIAIGDIYFREGALELAKIQFTKVLQPEYRSVLRVPDQAYAVLYRLAEIHELQAEYGSMENRLLEILRDHSTYDRPEAQRFRTAMLNAYLSRGLDHVLKLYRLEKARFALSAYAKLGYYYYRWGRFEPAAMMHSLFALDIMLTESVNELRRFLPLYEFDTLEGFLEIATRRPNVREYLVSEGFIRCAYYLAAATFAAGHPSRAAELWRVLAASRVDAAVLGPHADLARKQLQSPWVEPYLHPSARRIEFPSE
jgi:tetratricopeptide (TPR) repeat protein